MPEKQFKFIIEGGKATAGPPIGSSLGPLGLNVPMVVEKINEVTAEFMGMRVPVEITVNTDTKEFSVKVGTPTVAALIVKEAAVEKGSGSPGKDYVGNISIDSAIKIAKIKMPDLRAKTLKAALKQVVGTCVSMGIKVDGKEPKQVIKDIDSGLYDNMLGG
ncbi:MAG: 50S ribosomal protein L11 [Thaumarchaeota archaeon]|jgi:large subunit ribosomal protein L11|nr:50S ribosomal protein L11 [Candidatus Terraquivivens yellowstonensis]MCL7387742.1 50S ribosomal protein L11 [Candidatus Terraquivivens yellowstonensis]MCL7392742.1 50S ribosomal protein L11 [Candidatus Terraquivivens yellowstonensis]MCL7395177.1 50S ribosomal protein L11 [Candidatus Terraquivivens yellowstonensis]MCL7398405.1 50S ribosomal protein L11 [Candidatus Terraquivivens yellowstonensis]